MSLSPERLTVVLFYSGNESVKNQNEVADVQPAQAENIKKTNKSFVREMEFITMAEFESIPQ